MRDRAAAAADTPLSFAASLFIFAADAAARFIFPAIRFSLTPFDARCRCFSATPFDAFSPGDFSPLQHHATPLTAIDI